VAPFGIKKDMPVIKGFIVLAVIPLMVADDTTDQFGLPSVPTGPLKEVELYHNVAVTPLKFVLDLLPTSVSNIPLPLLLAMTNVTKLFVDVLVLPVYPVLPTVVFMVVCAVAVE
jgi:hypothetical protein